MGRRCIADGLRWGQGTCACVKCTKPQKDQSNMGSGRVKKSKTGKVSVDVMDNIVTQLNKLTDDIAALNLQAINDLGLVGSAIGEIRGRITAVEDVVRSTPVSTSKISSDILDALRYSMRPSVVSTPPKCKAHDIVDHKINGMLCEFYLSQHRSVHYDGSTCFCTYGCKFQTAPKVSVWRSPEERCKHLFVGVKHALRYYNNVSYKASTTSFEINLKLPYLTKVLGVSITSNDIELRYCDRNGVSRNAHYINTTNAAADIAALAAFYINAKQ